MNAPVNESSDVPVAPTAQTLFEKESLPFPPVPPHLAASLRAQGPNWLATRTVESTPYDLDHFLAEIEAQPGMPDYALVGFDGYGTNSWAMHYYLVGPSIALFIQMPWGGAYVEAGPARDDITEMLEWAGKLQSKLSEAEALHKIPGGRRLEVAASRFGHAGWRWLDPHEDNAETPWNPPAGMKAAMLRELDDIVGGQQAQKAGA
jgi:hypothetical protein